MNHPVPKIIAHRGASGDAPENTLVAFQEAWDQQSDGIECDVRCSADGVVVVMHDADGTRTLDDPRPIREMPFSELSALDAGSWKDKAWDHARVPDLRSVLAGVPHGREAVIELKSGTNLAPAVAQVVADFPNTEITLIAFNFDLLCEAKQLMPNRPALWLFGDWDKSARSGRTLGLDLLRKLIDGGVDGLDLGCHPHLTPELTEPIREAGMPIYAYTINQLAQIETCLTAGVDAITTDYPGRMREILKGAKTFRSISA